MVARKAARSAWVAASRVWAITDCSAHPGRPKARYKAESGRSVKWGCETAVAPASKAMKRIASVGAGVDVRAFWCRCRRVSKGWKKFLPCQELPSRQRLAWLLSCHLN